MSVITRKTIAISNARLVKAIDAVPPFDDIPPDSAALEVRQKLAEFHEVKIEKAPDQLEKKSSLPLLPDIRNADCRRRHAV